MFVSMLMGGAMIRLILTYLVAVLPQGVFCQCQI